MPNPTFVAVDSTQRNVGSTASDSLVVTKPAGTAEGDLLLAFHLGSNDNPDSVVGLALTASGWTALGAGITTFTNTAGTIATWARVFYKYAGPAEAASYTFGWSKDVASDVAWGVLVATYRNARAATDPVVGLTLTEQGAGFDGTAPSVTPTINDLSLLVCLFLGLSSGNPDTVAGMTERLDAALSGGSSLQGLLADENIVSGATGTRTATYASYTRPNPAGDLRWGISVSLSRVPETRDGGATLQGVGTTTIAGSTLKSGAAALQGIGTIPRAFGDAGVSPDFTVYDAYLSNLGLIFHQDEEGEYRPSTIPERLRPVRQDVGNSPFEVRPESGDYFAQGDFSGGQGQNFYHRPTRDETRYWRSDGFDIVEVGKLRHAHLVASAHLSANVGALTQADGLPFVADGTDVRRGSGTFPGTWTAEDPSGAEAAQTVEDLTAEGDRLFAALGSAGVHVRDSAGVWTHYQIGGVDLNIVGATRVAWLKDRLFVVGGTNSRAIYEATISAPTALETLPEGWVFEAIWEMGSFVYACAYNRDAGLGRVHHYGLNTAGTAVEKKGSTAWPKGQLPFSGIGFDATNGLVGVGKQNTAGGLDPVLYQVLADTSGFLSFVKVAEEEGSGTLDLPARALETDGETVLVGWSLHGPPSGERREGVATLHMARTAFAPTLKKETPNATAKAVRSVMVHEGRVLFSLSGDGLYYEDTTKFGSDAWLITSRADWNNAGQKTWDIIEDGHRPLPAGTAVYLDFTMDDPEEGDWTQAAGHTTTGEDGSRGIITGAVSRRFAIRIRSEAKADNTTAPEDINFSVRSNPKPERNEFRLSRYIRVVSNDRKDEQGEDVLKDPIEYMEDLLDLMYTTQEFLEPGSTWQVRVEGVSVVEPVQPVVDVTAGEPAREGFIVHLELLGTREG